MPSAECADLLAGLRDYQLLEPAQLAGAYSLLATCSHVSELISELVQRGWLTPFQAGKLGRRQAAELVVGSYLLLDQLGEGGMGTVYRARHRDLDRPTALKVIRQELLSHPDVFDRFRREARAAARLDHPHIVRLYDAGEAAGVQFLAMQFLDGVNLEELVQTQGQLELAAACAYLAQAALGLQHAHERGLIHRDVKPSNLLLVRSDGLVRVLDLGLASLGAEVTPLTPARGGLGTPAYMAPEQALDAHRADPRADVYSLGCTAYYLLTGRPPFDAATPAEALVKHQMSVPEPLHQRRPDIPAGLAALVSRMTAKQAAERVQTMAEVAAALQPFCGGPPGFSGQGVVPPAPAGVAPPASAADLGSPHQGETPLPTPVNLRLLVSRSADGHSFEPVPVSTLAVPNRLRDLRRRSARVGLRTGDLVRIEASTDQPGYLIVLNVGPTGNVNWLFPPDPSQPSPVGVDQPLHLLDAELMPPAGREQVIALWSRHPLQVRPEEVVAWARAGEPGQVRDLVSRPPVPAGDWFLVRLELDHCPREAGRS